MLFEDETNLFTYCYNNPIRYSEPSGMKAKVGNMGIIDLKALPSGSCTSKTIKFATAVTNLALYFYVRGYSLKYADVYTTSAVKKAIDKKRPVGILISDGLFSWHWIL